MPDLQFFDFLIIGNICTEFIIDLLNRSHPNVIGGSALYTAGGLRCWNDRIAVTSHAHEQLRPCIENLHARYMVDFKGVRFYSNYPDDRRFLGYVSPYEIVFENPVAFYASRNIVFPRGLIGYSKMPVDHDPLSQSKFFSQDMPACYWDISAAVICQNDLTTQIQLSSLVQKTASKILIIQSSKQYMKMANFEAMPVLMKDTTCFVTTKDQLLAVFQNRSQDIWEISEFLCSLGCEYMVIQDGLSGQYLFDRRTRIRYHIPFYPVKLVDPTGIAESFCGGFLAGLKKNFDPIEALICGSVSTSFTAEGIGPFYCADAIPALRQSRSIFVKNLVKKV